MSKKQNKLKIWILNVDFCLYRRNGQLTELPTNQFSVVKYAERCRFSLKDAPKPAGSLPKGVRVALRPQKAESSHLTSLFGNPALKMDILGKIKSNVSGLSSGPPMFETISFSDAFRCAVHFYIPLSAQSRILQLPHLYLHPTSIRLQIMLHSLYETGSRNSSAPAFCFAVNSKFLSADI